MNYYNEFDPFAAQWLRNLIDAGLIPPGDVDERSIKEVSGDDVRGYTQCHFFAGIGGWSLALEMAGWSTSTPVWTGSCPCQPFSAAGKRRGTDDERHLWPEFKRLIAECRPPVVFGEQVASADGRKWLAGIRTDLEGMGYGVGAADLCAAGIGAPHIRQRLWWVADTGCSELGRGSESEREYWRTLHAANGGRHGGLADTEHAERRAQHVAGKNGRDGKDSGRQEAYGEHGTCGQVRRLADAGSERCGWEHALLRREAGEPGRVTGETVEVAGGSTDGGLGDTPSDEQQGGEGRCFNVQRPWKASSYGDWLPCTDGKSRRIEPSAFPLAHAIPRSLGRGSAKQHRMAIRAARANRTGRLKGYGNAIVPELAAEFIRAYMDVAERK